MFSNKCPKCGKLATRMVITGQVFFALKDGQWKFAGIDNMDNRTFLCVCGHEFELQE